MNWAALYAPVVFLIWRNTLEAFLRNIKDLFVKKIKEIVKICTSIFFFTKRLYALSRLEPCHIFLVTEKKIMELSTLQFFIPWHSHSDDQPGMLFSILCVIINQHTIRPSIKRSKNCSADGSREVGH